MIPIINEKVKKSLPEVGMSSGSVRINWLTETSKVLGWVGVSAAGLGISLSAAGFLSRHAHNKMLGVPWQPEDSLSYIVDGSFFVTNSLLLMIVGLFQLKSLLVIFTCTAIFVISGLSILNRFHQTVTSILVGLLLGGEIYGLYQLSLPFGLRDLLLEGEDPIRSAIPIRDALLRADRVVYNEYGFLVLFILSLGAMLWRLGWIINRNSNDGSNKRMFWQIARLPMYALFLLCLYLIPGVHGILALPNVYPHVELSTIRDSLLGSYGLPLFFLRHDGKSFLIYECTSHTLLMVNGAEVAVARLHAPSNILKCANGDGGG